jgi:hypothetical protein
MMRPTRVRQMRSAFRAALADRRNTRCQIRRAIRRALHDHRTTVIGSLKAVLKPEAPTVSLMRSAFRSALADRRNTRCQIGRAIRRALHDHRTAVIGSVRAVLRPPEAPATRLPGVAGDGWESADPLQPRVLEIIQNHPDGVRALDVGNELGVDWRRVLGVTRHLADAGLVEQIDQDFYAVRKASRRW